MTEPEDLIRDAVECERCSGAGELDRGRTCPDCDGDGLIGDDPWADEAHPEAAELTAAQRAEAHAWDCDAADAYLAAEDDGEDRPEDPDRERDNDIADKTGAF
ncbi:hypothetical protein [Nocardia sp. NPDC059228]|uniref:hypothetical protein n=1 Tax=Nocardia sp. NPDC059228 TaxID=3346777 RepID=UPI0036A28995